MNKDSHYHPSHSLPFGRYFALCFGDKRTISLVMTIIQIANMNDNYQKLNYNNNDNNNACLALKDDTIFKESVEYRLFLKCIRYAYQEALRWKKWSHTIDDFVMHQEKNIFDLTDELLNNTYTPSKVTFFVIHDPVCREICAASFRDRIVHHLLHTFLYPIVENYFIADSYAARTDKWTSYGRDKIAHFMRQCTRNNTQQWRVLKIDIQSFFLAIDHDILKKQIISHLAKTKIYHSMPRHLWWWITKIIDHDHTTHYIRHGTTDERKKLPKEKSLFCCAKGNWLPLGNLTSQLFANIYLHPLDQFIKHVCKIRRYGRYMDDMVLIHQDKHRLLEAKHHIQEFVNNELKLKLHPKKVYLQSTNKWVPFLGCHIFPRWTILWKRTIKKWWSKMYKRNNENTIDAEKIRNSMNSYLWLALYGKNYHLRKQMIHKLNARISNKLHSSGGYKKIVLRVKKSRNIVNQDCNNFICFCDSMLYNQLPLYKELYTLNNHLLSIVMRFNQWYKYTLGSKIQDNALELLMLLYEAQSWLYDKKLMITKMRVRHEQLTVLLRLAQEKQQISIDNYLTLSPILISIGKQLTSRSQKITSSS